jgi:hypothetical protein
LMDQGLLLGSLMSPSKDFVVDLRRSNLLIEIHKT